jgi:hypothetical protein
MNNGIAIPAGKRRSPVRDPKHRNDLPTFPSARRNTGGAHEHDSGDKIWLACHQIDGNPTSKSVTDGHYGIDPETPAELVCDPRISRKRQAARHYSRSTEAEQVDSHHPVAGGRMLASQAPHDPPSRWIRRSTGPGPSPISTKKILSPRPRPTVRFYWANSLTLFAAMLVFAPT